MIGTEPLATLFGIAHVSIAPVGGAWVPMSWEPRSRPRPIGPMSVRDRALDRARAYVATYPDICVLDVPDGYDPVDRGMSRPKFGRLAWLALEGAGWNGHRACATFRSTKPARA